MSFMLTLAMVFTLLPNVGMITVQAAVQTTGIDLTVASPPTSGTNWTYDSAANTLYLNGVNISATGVPAVKVPGNTTIELIGLNTLTSDQAAILVGSTGSLTLQGSGVLDATSSFATGGTISNSNGPLTINSGYYKVKNNINTGSGSTPYSIATTDDITINGGYIDTTGNLAGGISATNNFTMNGGYLYTVSKLTNGPIAIAALNNIVVNGGYIEALAENNTTAVYGIRAVNGSFANNGGVVKVTASNTSSTSVGITAKTSVTFDGGVTIAKCGTSGSGVGGAVRVGSANFTGTISLSNSETGKQSDATTALFDNGVNGNYKFFAVSSGGATPATDVVVAKAFSNTTISPTTLDGHYVKITTTDTSGFSTTSDFIVAGGSYVESTATAVKAVSASISGAGTLVGISSEDGTTGINVKGCTTTGTLVGIAETTGVGLGNSSGTVTPSGSIIGKGNNGISFASAQTLSAGNFIGIGGTYGAGVSFSSTVTVSEASITGYGVSKAVSGNITITNGSVTALGTHANSAFSGTTININGGKVWAYNQGTGGSISATTFTIDASVSKAALPNDKTYGDGLTTKAVSGNAVSEKIAFFGGPTLEPPVSATGVTLNKSTTSIVKGDTETLTASVAPANATNKAVTWSSSNTGIATIANGVITAVAVGTATIIVTTADGGYTATCAVTVTAPPLSSIAVKTPPTKVAYTYGEIFAPVGMVIEATYTDNSKADVTGYTYSPNGTLTMSDTTIIISYTEGGITKETTQSITMQKATATEAMKTATGTVSKVGAKDTTITLPTKPAGATYGTPTAGGTITMTGMSLNGDVLTYTAPASTEGDTGTITISVTNATNYNDYSITVTITSTNKIPVTITGLTDPNKTYDGSAITDGAFGTPNYSPDWSGILTYTYYEGNVTTGAALSIAPKDAGDYTLVAAIPDSDAGHAGSATVPFTIAKKDITITADDKSMIKGGTPPTYTVSYAGFVSPDTSTTALSTEAVAACSADGQTAGDFPITFSTQAVLNGTGGANYTITAHNNGTLTVNESTHTVTFDSQGGSAVSPLTNVINGAKITAPTAPIKTNNIFGGWYKEPACTTAWDFGNDTVTADITLYAKWTQVLTYTISASAGSGGTISPSGSVSVASGASQTFTISPYSNYSISNVVVDGVNQGAISSYTFTNVTANHTITVSFTYHDGGGGGGSDPTPTPNPTPVPTPTPTIPSIGNVTDSKQQVKQDVKINIIVSSKDSSKTDSPVVSVTVKDKAVSVGIPQSVVTDAIKTATDLSKNNGEKTTVKFDLTASDNFKTMNAELPKAAMTELAKNVDNLVIQTQLGVLNLDKKAMTTVANAATKSVTISTVAVDKTALPKETQTLVGDKPVYDFTITSGNKTISNFGNGRAVITLPYTLTKGEKANNIVIYYLGDKGNLEVVKSCNYDEKTKTVSFATTHFSKYTVGLKTASYLDVPQDWYTNAVEYVTIRGLFNGYNGNFTPKGTMTRAMFVQVLANLEGISPTTYIGSVYADVDKNAWYSGAVMWATSNKLIRAKDGLIKPDEAISREEMAVILYNYIKYKGIDLNVVNDKPFADINDVSTEAKTAVEFMKKYGLIEGMGNNTYAPKRIATRAEVAAIFTNVIQVLAK